jgi:DNA (cytosine-5)-methyltransferase 1
MEIRAVHEAIAEREVCGCLSDGAHMGGGLNGQDAYSGRIMAVRTEPVVIDRAAFNQGQNAQYKPRIEHSETMDSLVARGPHAVAIPIHDQATRHSGKHGDKQDGKGNGLGVGKPGDPCPTLTKGDKHAVLYENHPNDSRVTGPHDVAPSCVSRYGTGGGNVPLVQEAIAFPATMSGTQCAKTKNLSPAICSVNQTAVAVDTYNHALQEKAVPIRSTASDICHTGGVINPADRMAVRRLTPRECERLQGFPDDHTLIPWRNKPADQCPDGPRYKALGNSMAVPCMAWIGKRIDAVEKTK